MSLHPVARSVIGLALVAGPISFMTPNAVAQNFIDVEAERRQSQGSTAAPTTGQGAVSYGVSGAPAAVSSAATSSAATAASPSTTRRLPPPAAPSSDNIGGLFNQVQQLQQEVMRLNGLVEQQAYELRVLKEQSLERYVDIDRRLSQGGGVVAGGMAGTDAGEASGGDVSTSSAGSLANVAEQPGEGDAYRASYALVRGQEFDQALTAFNAFLQNYPDGKYAPNAHYWLGELYLVIDPADPEAARQAFMLLLSQYPQHSKVPDALYKLGRVHFMKGSSNRAREFLNRAIKEYPNSGAARLASDFIDQNL